jgi:hypothetical protein
MYIAADLRYVPVYSATITWPLRYSPTNAIQRGGIHLLLKLVPTLYKICGYIPFVFGVRRYLLRHVVHALVHLGQRIKLTRALGTNHILSR